MNDNLYLILIYKYTETDIIQICVANLSWIYGLISYKKHQESVLYFFNKLMKKFLRIFPIMLAFMWYVYAADLANISLDYCTTSENALQYQVTPGVETGICYNLSNSSKTPVTVKLSFIDGTFTNDQRQNKACLSDADIENFWQYVTGYDQLITLKAGETIQKEAKLLYPIGMDGYYHWCVVYSVVQVAKSSQWATTSFSILMRRAKFIDVIVGNPANAQGQGIALDDFTGAEGGNISHNPKIRIYKDTSDDSYVIQLKVHNISRIEQNVVITGVASNILTYKNTFVETRRILKGEVLTITKKLTTIPPYNLNVKFSISNTPFSFGGQAPVVWMIETKTTIWIWDIITYITIIWILLFVGIVILLVKDLTRRREKVSTAHTTHKYNKHKK